MTNEEIEAYRQQLIDAKKIKDNGQRNIALIALCDAVGASGCGGDKPWPERDAQNIASIQEALKTAAMINMAKRPVFPTLSRLPSSIKESQFSPFEAEDYPEDGDVLVLMEKMFHKPEIDFYYFKEKGKQQSTAIDSAIERGDIIEIESQFYWYRHPNTGHDRDFTRIELPEHEWHHEAIKKSPMFIRTELKLSERKRIEIESWLKVRMEESFRLQAKRIFQTNVRCFLQLLRAYSECPLDYFQKYWDTFKVCRYDYRKRYSYTVSGNGFCLHRNNANNPIGIVFNQFDITN